MTDCHCSFVAKIFDVSRLNLLRCSLNVSLSDAMPLLFSLSTKNRNVASRMICLWMPSLVALVTAFWNLILSLSVKSSASHFWICSFRFCLFAFSVRLAVMSAIRIR